MRGKLTAATVLAAGAVLTAAVPALAAGTGTGTGTGSGAAGVPAQSVLRFAKGATSATVSGHVAAGEDDRYVFDARAGQVATFHLTRANSGQTWTLVGPSGPAVHDAHSPRQSDFTHRLPETGRYYVDITTTRAGSYRMQVSIPAAGGSAGSGHGTGSGSGTGTGTRPVVAEATRITFPRGRTSATVEAEVGPQQRAAYTFSARAGQRARIALSGSRSAAFTLVAPDGTPLHTTRSRNQSDVTVALPATGLYRIDVQDDTRAGTRELTLSVPRR
ncbi:peptidase [Kineococcus sp. SYSU DK005]|uniref:peptidase n=1 Tax=Kineococcus sp. SYSU DK005 TaxID=3383126 RepID=UPI003D7F075F